MKKLIYRVAIAFLGLCILLAIGAYFIATDRTRHANNQIPDVSLRDPGYRACFQITKIHDSGQLWYQRGWSGDVSIYKYRLTTDGSGSSCMTFWFGTDKYGRDVWSRILVGLRYTLIIGLGAVLFSLVIGMLLGSLAGYFGGKTDQLISILINVFWSLPTILLAFAIILSFGRSMVSLFIAIGLTMWGDVARLVRAQVLASREMVYVQAGKALGFSDVRILFRQILPNIMGPVWVAASGNFALAVLLESGLSFLGFGLQPPVPSLGNILQEQYSYAISGKPMLALIPSIVVVLLILSFQVITSQLRDQTDVRMSKQR
ncbi:MAG TPA: ABC transporter permease [Saprospiraceae bacterium]|nr:ABC transporter permease [Saprospiraceae bacterium]